MRNSESGRFRYTGTSSSWELAGQPEPPPEKRHATVRYEFEDRKSGELRWVRHSSIDWTKPLDPQLYKLFGLTEEEIAIVEGEEL